ncbi:SoxR reducing system RseC family protein [Microbacterium sp.]|uniref:SoxR reducing system RseC family protein n=1 Tax=Microbacterium sp. TaxID=51671 RepID=UPI0027345D25|nr:SoxR reducing system RseC family protein [Microbacterium sp.]MDP3949178.1 SoxR reducing system RseC family protein [Microbacterium sp.]
MNNRELASFILLGLFVLWAPTARSVRGQLPSLLRQLFFSTITLFLVPFVALIVGSVWVASRVGFWSSDLVAATALWFLLVGFVWFMNLGDAGKDPDFFKRRFLGTLGLAAFLEFFMNAQVFPLWLELIAQLCLLTVVLLNVLSSANPEQKPIASCTAVLMAVATIGVLVYSCVKVVTGWDTLVNHDLVNELLMPIWLTGVSVLLLYVYAVYVGYEVLFLRLSFLNERKKLSLRARSGIVLGLRGALVDVDQFRGPWAFDAARASTVRDARRAVARFKEGREVDRAARASARKALADLAGVQGVDDDGLVLDRREFEATKDALRWVWTCHAGWYQNEDRPDEYRVDLLDAVLVGSKQLEFDSAETVLMKVRSDRKAWLAYRRTPSGHVFGIGAAGPPPSQWFYDGPLPPSGFPSKKSTGWTGVMSPDRPEWRFEPKV